MIFSINVSLSTFFNVSLVYTKEVMPAERARVSAECAIAKQGQIMLANQRVCLHFASLTNQNA
jgi:hypothetical protein